jgi:hypothetical protein
VEGIMIMDVIFQNQFASFRFNQSAVKNIILRNRLKYYDEALNLVDQISQEDTPKIVIPDEPNYFDYVALDLIATGEGNVFCKRCIKKYEARQLKRIHFGYQGNPFDIKKEKKKLFKHLFRKRIKPPEMYGGRGYICPENHEVISMIIWKTF